ncbi:MAG: VWA domain-containing protein [Candidatus Methanospirareceae archaeon]
MKNVVKFLCILVFAMLVVTTVVRGAGGGEYVETNASVNPGVIQLGENTEVTIALTGNGTPEIIIPLDVVLVMDCSGSMKRYGTIITNLSEVTLTTSYQKVGEFTISAPEDVEVMLQTLPGRGYGADVYYSPYDKYLSYLKNKVTGARQPEKSGFSVVRWNNLQPGTYEVYAKLNHYRSGYTQPQRVFCVELPPTRREGAKGAANEFVDLLKDDDRVAVVKFHSNNWVYSGNCNLICNLWEGKSAAKNAINGLPASGGTPMGEGLDRALDHLIENGRDGAVKAIILLTDGWWNMGCSPIDQAHRAANHGIPIYVIGWGGVNYDELTQIAEITGGECYFPATVEDLEGIYEGLAKELSNITAKNVILRVELTDSVEYADNASKEPEINGKVLEWDLGAISVNQTKSISFDVRPEVSGEVKLNTDNSSITYEDVYGHLHEVQLPVLSVRVTGVKKNLPPVASFTVSNETPETNQRVEFDASSSYDPDGSIVAYRWDFDGDGVWDIEGNVVTITHSYNKSGNYTVKLEVEDNIGAKNSTTKEINIIDEYLFSMQEGIEEIAEDLTNGTIPVELKSEFENNNISLSDNASVTKEEDEWIITDEDERFIVKKEEGTLNIYREGAGKGISGNVTWNGKHTIEGLGGGKVIGVPQHINAVAREIKNTRNSTVNVIVELRVDGLLLNSTTESLKPYEQKDITVSAAWVPMSSGIHNVLVHAYDGPYWVGPTNDPGTGVEVYIERVKS